MKKLDINRVPVTTAILFLICIIVTAALAGTNFITKDRIALLNAAAEKKAMSLVLPAEKYEEAKTSFNNTEYTYFVAKDGEDTKGYLITTSTAGYGGEIKIMVGVNNEGRVTGVNILSASDETPGLGANVTKKSFYSQFTDKVMYIVLQKNLADASKNEIKAVTGATISSTAVTKAVNSGLEILDSIPKDLKTETEKDGEE